MLVIEEGSPWALFTFVEGIEYDFSRMKQTHEAARRLAEFHTVTDSFQHQEVVIDISQMPDWWANSREEIQALEEFFTGAGVDNELTCIREYVNELLREWPLERNALLRLAWVHGDYHGRNMVFVGDEMRGLFDFDVIHRGFRISDVSLAMFNFGREYRGSSTIRSEVAQSFLEEYTRHSELRQEELQALPIFAVLYLVPFAAYYAMLRRDGEDAISYLRRDVELICSRRSEMKRLESIFK